jgi:glycosyltransferase involved in cell wall biosynthesis
MAAASASEARVTAAGDRIVVVHVAESLGRGGAERNLVDRIVTGDQGRFVHHVVSLMADDALASELRVAGATLHLFAGRGLRDLPRLMLRLTVLLRRLRPDVVHTQLVTADIAGRLASLLAGRPPVVSTLQNMPYDPRAQGSELPRGWRGGLVKRADRLLGRWTRTRFVAVSSAVRDSYVSALGIPPERTEVIYNAVDISALRARAEHPSAGPGLRAELDLAPGRRLIVNVARHVPQKGLEYLIDSLSRPPLRGIDCGLALVGVGGGTPALRSRVEAAGLGDRVRFLGRREDVAAILAAADVFAFPSLYEGLPVALLEALALGVPAVASDIPEIREVASESGASLVPPANADALAVALAAILQDPVLASRRREEGPRLIRERFDLRRTTGRFEAVLLEAAQARRRATSR